MKLINMKRRSGKTTMLINTAYIMETPIITWDSARADNVKAQAQKMGLDVEVYSLEEWRNSARLRCGQNQGVLVDEAGAFFSRYLEETLHAPVVAATITLPMIESKDVEEG